MRIVSQKIDISPQEELLGSIAPLSDFLFLDIETTGLSAENAQIYLIGCAYRQSDSWDLIQWMDTTGKEEKEILSSFLLFASGYGHLVHYNGGRFDLPFLRKRLAAHSLEDLRPDAQSIDLYAAIVPAKEVGGDLYDFFLQDDRLCFCVGDVSGKGIPASLTMAVAVNLFRTVAKEGFPPEVIAAKLNDTMSANNENAVFVTMFIGIIDLKTGNLDYCNCGHNSPVYGERRMLTSQTVFRFLDVEFNVPIGLWPGYTFVGGHLSDIRGSTLFVYTDGINEAENRMLEQFGKKRMLRVLRESTQPFGERTPKTRSHFLIEEMKCALDAFVDGAEQSDDLTMLCVSIK